jgi:hypothetical protein
LWERVAQNGETFVILKNLLKNHPMGKKIRVTQFGHTADKQMSPSEESVRGDDKS